MALGMLSTAQDWIRARESGSSTHQTTPPGSNSHREVPSSLEIARSIITEPNPLRVGGITGGPPLSCHSKLSRVSSVSPSTLQFNRTQPSLFESAPYLIAFVASSCSAKPSNTALPVSKVAFGPSTRNRLWWTVWKGASACSTMSGTEASPQCSSVSRSCARAKIGRAHV